MPPLVGNAGSHTVVSPFLFGAAVGGRGKKSGGCLLIFRGCPSGTRDAPSRGTVGDGRPSEAIDGSRSRDARAVALDEMCLPHCRALALAVCLE